MRKTKRLVALVLCLIMFLSCFQLTAFCETASVMNLNISTDRCELTISGVKSTSTATMQTGKSMPLSIKMELQKIKSGTYTTIETWTASRTGMTLSMSEDRLINILATYRLKVTFTAGNETIVRYAYP